MKDRIHEIFPMSMADMVDEIKKAKAAQIGETRIGESYQMGNVRKIDLKNS